MELKGKTCMSHKPDWVTEEELWREPCVHTSGGFDQKWIELMIILNDFLSDLTLNSEVFGLAIVMNSAAEMHLFYRIGTFMFKQNPFSSATFDWILV